MSDLEELLSDALAGDRSAFACLLERETPSAYRAALAILRSPEEARDVVQDAAIRAWQGLPRLQAEARRNPLPFGFASGVVNGFDDRRWRRFRWFSGIPAAAATIVLAVVAVAVPLSLSRPPTTPVTGTSEPTARPSVTASLSPATPSPTAQATPAASAAGLTEAEAVDAARSAADRLDMIAVHSESGPASEVLRPRLSFDFADVPPEDTWVWLINLSDGGPPLGQEGSIVVIDYFDGTVYGVMDWIS